MTGIRSNAERVISTASQSLLAARATNRRRFSPARSLLEAPQDPRLGVKLQELATELFQHVVRDDQAGLADHPEPPQLGDTDDHLRGLARPDLVKEPHSGLTQHPRDRRTLVGTWLEGARQTGERQALAFRAVIA